MPDTVTIILIRISVREISQVNVVNFILCLSNVDRIMQSGSSIFLRNGWISID